MIFWSIVLAIGMVIVLVTCVPVTYVFRICGDGPVRLTGRLSWGTGLLRYGWEYTYGEKPVVTKTWLGKTTRRTTAVEEPLRDEDVAAAAAAIEAEDGVTYDDVRQTAKTPDAETPELPQEKRLSWRSLVGNTDFLAAVLTYFAHLLWHSRLRYLTLDGSLGLGQPHTTGMLAGACYALMPDSASRVTFNYLAEDYDCTLRLAGRMYPLVCLYYTLCFAATKPARRVLAYWRKGGASHG